MKSDWTFKHARRDRWIEEIMRAVVLNLGRIFYRVKIIGAENIPARGGVIVVCNHVSYADTIPLSLASRRRFRFTSFAGLFDVPILGRGLRAFGSIPVSPSDARLAIRRISDCAAAGEAVLLFPEGKLTLDGRMQEIKSGYLLAARRAGCPIVMAHLDGLWGSVFSHEGGRCFFKRPRCWRRSVTVRFSQPRDVPAAAPECLEAFWMSGQLADSLAA